MAWSFISQQDGAHTTSTNPTATLPPTYTTDDLLLLFINKRDVSETITVAPDQGYVLLGEDDAGVETSAIWIYGKIATSGSETAPTWTFSGTATASYFMASFRDSLGPTAIGSIVHALAKGDTTTNNAATITYPALTITVDNCLVLVMGRKRKAVDEATTVNALAGFTEIDEFRRTNASSTIAVWTYQIQTTATSITSGTLALTTWTEASTTERALTIALLATAVATLDPIRLIWRV